MRQNARVGGSRRTGRAGRIGGFLPARRVSREPVNRRTLPAAQPHQHQPVPSPLARQQLVQQALLLPPAPLVVGHPLASRRLPSDLRRHPTPSPRRQKEALSFSPPPSLAPLLPSGSSLPSGLPSSAARTLCSGLRILLVDPSRPRASATLTSPNPVHQAAARQLAADGEPRGHGRPRAGPAQEVRRRPQAADERQDGLAVRRRGLARRRRRRRRVRGRLGRHHPRRRRHRQPPPAERVEPEWRA